MVKFIANVENRDSEFTNSHRILLRALFEPVKSFIDLNLLLPHSNLFLTHPLHLDSHFLRHAQDKLSLFFGIHIARDSD